VLDSSATLAWIYSDETTECIREVFDAVADHGAIVPSLWRLEVANSLTAALRRGRIDAGFRNAALADLAFLDIRVDPETERQAWGPTLELADRFRLTIYDAAYVELASRRKIPLATLDAQMRAAGDALGLQLLGGEGG
jgi:predicted nucleic acid-binding protein